MSQSPSTSTNFRTIFVAAMKAYEKKTKTDLLTHPLATQLQSCNSSSDILAVLHDKVNEFDKSRSHNERLSSWLDPTINVLYAFSSTVGQGIGLVSIVFASDLPLISSADILTCKYHICWHRHSLLGENLPRSLLTAFSTPKSVRLPRMSVRVKKPLPISLIVSRTSSNDSNHIRKCHQRVR